ncbi:MAG: DUF368 domain-containing protein [Lachnospiraceae bacterium]|jgi:putative membrane protein|nr:DUF368 domain-containing protein [Lachnospiraceae bacterium]
MNRFLYRTLCGFFLGLSIFAPGFSGSVIAIIMGFYHDLVRIASNPFKDFKKNVVYCLPLGIGVVLSGVLFVLLFAYLFDHYEQATYFLFIGLIAGNIPSILGEVKKSGFRRGYIIGICAAFAISLFLALVSAGLVKPAGAAGMQSPLWLFALGGFIAGAAALVPGMSVSMLLILTGIYGELIFIANALLHLELSYLLPFCVVALCTAVGLVAASRLIKYVFRSYPGIANSLVLGFMCGSLIGILVNALRMDTPGFTWWLGAVMLAIGLGICAVFVVLGNMMGAEGEA